MKRLITLLGLCVLSISFTTIAYNNPLIYAYINGVPLVGVMTEFPNTVTPTTMGIPDSEKTCYSPDEIQVRSVMYHYIREPIRDPPGSVISNNSISPQAFEQHMSYLKGAIDRGAVDVMFFSEFERTVQRGCFENNKIILLTSDDGRRDNYGKMFPILKQYNIPMTLGLVSEKLGVGSNRNGPFLNETEVKEMLSTGLVEVQSHSQTHADLAISGYDKQFNEICASKRNLENTYNISINTFIYPAGRYNTLSLELLKACGYSYALTTVGGDETMTSIRQTPYERKRMRVTKSSTPQELFTFE